MNLRCKQPVIVGVAVLVVGCAPSPPRSALPAGDAKAPPAVSQAAGQSPVANPSPTDRVAPSPEAAKLAGVYIATLNGDMVSSRLELKRDGTFLALTRFKDDSLNVETTGVWKAEKDAVVLQVRKANGKDVDPRMAADNRLKIADGGRKLTDVVASISYERG